MEQEYFVTTGPTDYSKLLIKLPKTIYEGMYNCHWWQIIHFSYWSVGLLNDVPLSGLAGELRKKVSDEYFRCYVCFGWIYCSRHWNRDLRRNFNAENCLRKKTAFEVSIDESGDNPLSLLILIVKHLTWNNN